VCQDGGTLIDLIISDLSPIQQHRYLPDREVDVAAVIVRHAGGEGPPHYAVPFCIQQFLKLFPDLAGHHGIPHIISVALLCYFIYLLLELRTQVLVENYFAVINFHLNINF
jgi:hypothetical protein